MEIPLIFVEFCTIFIRAHCHADLAGVCAVASKSRARC